MKAKVTLRKTSAAKRKLRVRGKVRGDSKNPRLSVFRSNKYLRAQIIDDSKGKTLLSTLEPEVMKLHQGKKKSDAAFELGKAFAKEALAKKVKSVVFDRGAYKYHGRVKRFAEGVREGGLQF